MNGMSFLNGLFNSLCGPTSKKHQTLHYWPFVRGIHRWPVNFPHKGPVSREKLPFDDVIMANLIFNWGLFTHMFHITVSLCWESVSHRRIPIKNGPVVISLLFTCLTNISVAGDSGLLNAQIWCHCDDRHGFPHHSFQLVLLSPLDVIHAINASSSYQI